MSLIKMPYTNLHELNLDWIIEQLNKSGPVISVNGKQGIVSITAEDIGRTPNNPQTVEQALTSQGSSIQTVRTEIGVTPLPTTAQTITGAIAEHEQDITDINTEIGNTPLPTIAQTLTGAIAENAGEIANVEDNVIGNTPLGTTATTLTGAIAEHEGDINNINNKIGNTSMGTTATTLTGAIAEHEDDINNINNKINTTATITNLLSAFQAVYTDIDNSSRIVHTKQGIFNTIQLHLVTNAAVSSGYFTLPVTINYPKTEIYGSITSLDGKTGWIQINADGTVYLRCQSSTPQFICGQISWMA